ncbi:rab-GTPase-TBC domain-containing protein, partial [Powellomyces hirtus]
SRNPLDIPRDAVQVELDVNRSLTHLLPPNTGGKRLARMRADLSGLIISVLQKHPYLHYYQGFHDVATVCLLVLKPVLAARCLESLALFYLRDYMTPTLQSALNQIHLLFPLLSRASPPIHTFLTQVDGLLPYFCLSWVITWYSHNINNAERIARLFDFMIASNPLMPIYIAAAVVISQKDLLLEEEPEYSSIHHFLSQFPANHNVEHLIKQAQSLYNSYPPHILQKIARQRLGKASCVTRHAQDIERLPFAEHSDGNRPKNLIQRHIADTTASTAPSRALGGRFASNAKQVAWLAAFAATTAIAWYALEIGAQYGYLA